MKNAPAPTREPAVDDHFVKEGSRVEVVRGILLMTPPAEEPHATLHFSLAYVLAAHLAPGYTGAVDMLTRSGLDSDFAPDASVYATPRDVATGGRQLEELAFEVASTQPLDSAAEKARELSRRGVRRVFCLVVKHRRVLEWSTETDGWSPLLDSATLADRCFSRPLPVRALVDAAAGDDAVVAALVERGSPVLTALTDRAEARGEARGEARALVAVLTARGLVPTGAESDAIFAADVEMLDRWLIRALTVSSVADLLG